MPNYFKEIFDLRNDNEHEEKIIENIHKNIEFKGANLWALIFAIFIASIGLNLNSIPVIIGAMLISPLMGPIVGLGLGLGTNDSSVLRRSMRSLGIATVMSISISTLYFYLSPINTIQSELLARTSPTIYDVLIAFFGGLAGIVGSTRREKSNVIPGVAIATALMPPLCTVGYGIATGQSAFFLGALYLYAINCLFICLATLIGIKYLKLPSVSVVDTSKAVMMRRTITLAVVVMIVPAVYFAYTFVQENNFRTNVERYLEEEFRNKGYTIVYQDISYKSSPHKIELAFFSKEFSESEIHDAESALATHGLVNTDLIIRQRDSVLTEVEWQNALANMKNESEKILALEAKLQESQTNTIEVTQILKEVQVINPRIIRVALGELTASAVNVASTTPDILENEVGVVLLYIAPDQPAEDNQKNNDDPAIYELAFAERDRLTSWLRLRLENDVLETHFLYVE